MLKNGSVKKALLVSVSVCSLFGAISAQAHTTPDNESFFRTTVSKAWKKAPDLGVTKAVTRRATSFVKGKAALFLEKSSGDIAKAVQNKVHTLIYRDASVKVVDLHGNHIGYVETVAPQLVRNILKNQLGFDLDNSVPGVPAFAMKAIGNYLENYFASTLENSVFGLVQSAAEQATLLAVGKALGVAESEMNGLVQKQQTQAQTSKNIKSALTVDDTKHSQALKSELMNGTKDKVEQEAYESIAAGLYRNLAARLKISTSAWIDEAVNDVATQYAHKLIDQTGELSLRYAEVGTAAGIASVVTVTSGGTLGLVATGAMAADQHLADGAKEETFLRSGLKKLFGYDSLVSSVKHKVANVVRTSLNLNKFITTLSPTAAKWIVPTDKDYNDAYGTYKLMDLGEEDGGFSLFAVDKAPVTFTSLVEAAKEKISRAKETVKKAATAFVEAADEFSIALNPMMDPSFWDDEPQEPVQKVQGNTSSKSWYQFWK